MKLFNQQLLNAPDDIKWLKETHLKDTKVNNFHSFVMWGNEDSPQQIDLYLKKDPLITDLAIRFKYDEESDQLKPVIGG